MRIPPDQTTHGKSYTKVYKAWSNMKDRCLNPNSKSYVNYGGRGIIVCANWLNSFESFYETMGEPPTKKHTLDRVDNNRDYEPGNCRWTTMKDQNKNQTKTIFLTFNGKTQSLSDWGRELNINLQTLHSRRRAGYSVEKILGTKKYAR